ncbi:putative ATP-dependent DNA helicase Q1 [Pecten maximus]|uniref:putative ATP-dependent DNA helicase Q1 n=1 Tax=Pecten maximus TaxID=6579 RepID=UPI001458E8A9|nr:putative ATP-dependent DNA helicase Q1 [Pecten maximus]
MAAPFQQQEIVCNKFKIQQLRSTQIRAISSVNEGKDVFVGTRTGSGKSLAYESYPLLNEGKIVLVVAPLVSIMDEQCRRLNELGFKATYIGKSNGDNDAILAGHFDFIFGSAEQLVEDTTWRAMLTTEPYQSKLGLIVVDEAHTVIKWGQGTDKEGPFRGSFSRIGELRSLCNKVQILALTATAGPTERRRIMKSLCFRSESDIVVDSPDRPNIKITTICIPNNDDLSNVFKFLIDDFQRKTIAFPRHVIFCESIANVSKVYLTFLKHVGQLRNHFEMYHSKTNDKIKEQIRKDMSESGNIRVLICTNSAGMGVNFHDVNNIIHYGLPREMDTFVQQMGRAGRDGGYSNELVLYKLHKGHLGRVEGELVKLVKDDVTCRHKTLCDSYVTAHAPITPKHKCCDVCEKQCDCGEECCPDIHKVFTVHDDIEDEDVEMERDVTDEDKKILKHKLSVLKYSLESDLSNIVMKSEILHGITDQVIEDVVSSCHKIFTTSDVLKMFPVWSFEVAVEIMTVINTVTGDTEMYNMLSMSDEVSDDDAD